MNIDMNFGKLFKAVVRVGLLMALAGELYPAQVSAAEFTARTIADTGGIDVMEVVGDYYSENSDGSTYSLPREVIAQEFYKTHADRYDFLVFFTNFDFPLPKDAVAFYVGVKNDTKGIGQKSFDYSGAFTSKGVLQGTIDMGNLKNVAADPLEPKFSFTMGILSHELFHRWGAYVHFKAGDGSVSNELLGQLSSHWSFLLDTKGSLEYGNNWHDNGNGTFTSFPGRKYFSPLDLYLMGLIDKSSVPPMLLIANPDVDPKQVSQSGVTIGGRAGSVTVDQIIAAEGARIPDLHASQKSFRIGCVFLTRPDTYNPDSLLPIRTVISQWPVWFSSLTNGLAQVVIDAELEEKPATNPGPGSETVDPRTLPPEITDGVAWLVAQQQADGSWQDDSATGSRDTAEALRVLKNFPELFPDPTAGADYLAGVVDGNNDFISRKTLALSVLDYQTTDQIASLTGSTNRDGAWGGGVGEESNNLDSGLVSRALVESGLAVGNNVAEVVTYLVEHQNQDGGWGRDGQGSDLLTTSYVMVAFSALSSQAFSLSTQLDKACAWLQTRQNSDGGFGDDGSTVDQTALVFCALKKAGISGTVADKALNYIGNTQAGDGSWNRSVYQTALAVSALWTAEKEPDLVVTSAGIRITPDTITVLPTQIEIVADIANKGLPNLPTVTIALYDGEEKPANLLAEQSMAVDGKSVTQARFAVTVRDGMTHRFLVVADPENRIAESSEANNRAMRWLYPEATYDLAIGPADLQATPAEVAYSQPVTIVAKVSNRGTLDVFKVPLMYYLDEGASQYALTTRYIDVPAGGTTTDEFIWSADHPGANQQLTVVADPFNAFREQDESNNQAVSPLTVQQTTKANLKIGRQDLTVTPSPALEAADALISATVTNNGFAAVQNAVVEFRSARPDNSENSLLGLEIIPELAAGVTTTVTHLWKSVDITGDRIISVSVDPDNKIDEITKDDNQTFTDLNILTLPDLAVSAGSIGLSPAYPKEGEGMSVQVVVQNNGGQTVNEVAVALALDGGAVKVSHIPVIAGNSVGSITFSLAATEVVNGVHKLQVVVDPDNLILEKVKTNNRAEKEFGVQNGDMWLTERYFSPNGDGVKDSTSFFFRLKKPQTVQVAISNSDGVVVRKYTDPAFSETLSGNIIWDGLNDQGTVVRDGEYRIGVIATGGAPLGSLVVTVDTNRSSFLEAVGTEFLLQNNLTCMLPDFEQVQWLKDESGLIVSIAWPNSNTPDYPTGLYKVSPDGEDVTRLIPMEWVSGVGGEFDYSVRGYAVSPDDESIAFILDKSSPPYLSYWSFVSSQLWVVDRYGENLRLLAENDFQVTGKKIYFANPQWLPGGDRVTVTTQSYDSGYTSELWLVDSIGHEPVQHFPAATSWSPDGKHFAYLTADYGNTGRSGLLVADRTGTDPDGFFPISDISGGLLGEWAPDGSRFAYWVSQNSSSGRDLEVVSTSGDIISETKSELNGGGNLSWLRNEKIVATESDGIENSLRLIDVVGNTPMQTLSEQLWGNVLINQTSRPGVAFIEYTNGAEPWVLKYCDNKAQCKELHATAGSCVGCHSDEQGPTDLQWSPDGEKMAFIDWSSLTYDYTTGTEGGMAYLVVVDPLAPTDKKKIPIPGVDVHYPVSLQWYEDSTTLLGKTSDGIFVIDSQKETIGIIPVADSLPNVSGLSVSPYAKYLSYEAYVSAYSICADAGSQDIWAVSSLLNLTADLRAIKKKDYIELKGIASDRNFSSYELEFSEVSHPNDWYTISPPSSNMAVNKVLGQWVPPGKGRYYVRLTATDKAGNSIQNRIRLSWGFNTAITGLYQSTDLFSPNGDGIKDTVEIHYRIMVPVHLEFTVLDKDQNLVKTFRREYTVTGEDFITWDGRDSSGRVVPDGLYTIRVLDFDFPVEVDNTPPVVSLKINQTDCRDPFDAEKHIACEEPFVSVSGEINDRNIQGWVLESGEGDNPSEWPEVSSTATGALFTGEEVAQLGNKKFRLTAIDAAGNRSSATSPLVEGMLLIQGWRQKDESGSLLDVWQTGFKFFYANGQYDDSQGIDIIVPPDSALGRSEIRAVETFGLPLLSGFVQEWQAGVWRDTQKFAIANDGDFVVSWNNTGAEMIRLKVIDEQGGVHYSNSLRISHPLGSALDISLGSFCLDPDFGDHGVAATLSNPNGVGELVYSYALEGRDDWQVYRSTAVGGGGYNRAQNYIASDPFTDVHVPKLSLNGEYYTIRMEVYNEYGYLIRTLYCRYPEICGKTGLGVSYQSATACNSVAPGQATLAHMIEMPDFVTVQQERYMISERVAPEDYPPKPPKTFPPPVPPAAPPILLGVTAGSMPVNTAVMAEGVYPVKSEVTFTYGTESFVCEGQNALVVDRRIPEINLSSPAAGQKICPVKITKEDGATVNVISVNGNGTDYFSNAVSFGASCAAAAHPEDSLNYSFYSLKQTAQNCSGQMIVDNIKDPELIFTLTGTDWVGNLGCTVNNFEIDTVVDFKDAHTDKEIFSSNIDEVGFDFTVDEDAKADLLIIVDPGNDDFRKLSVVRNLLNKEQVFTGQTSGASWDGTNNAGTVAPDGKYAAYLILTDSCGNQRKGLIGRFILDNTPPVARIDYPLDGAQVGGVVEMSGVAADVNFAKYTLSLDQVGHNVFQYASPGQVKGGVLGTWQAFGLDGWFVITLEVSDKAGNTSTVSIEVQRSLNDKLIKQFSVTPSLFSPNGDGKKETALIQYELNPEIALPLHTTINILDENQQPVWSFNASYVTTGILKTVSWNGRNLFGQLSPDGKYVVELKAYYPDSPEIFQIERLSLELDATQPEISIKFPTPNSYLSNNPLNIVGSVSDTHLAGYQVTLVGASETQVVDEGTEPRTNYKFAALNDLADGPYTLKVEASDLGEIVASKPVSFEIDRNPPKVLVNTPVNGAVYGGADHNLIDIDASISELNLAHWQLKYFPKGSQLLPTIVAEGDSLPVDNDVVTDKLSVGAASGLAEGTYVLSLSAVDKAGLKGEKVVLFDIDRTPPELAITEPVAEAWVTKPLDLLGTANDLHLQEYTLEIAPGDCAAVYEWSPIGGGGSNSVVAGKLGHWQIMPPDGDYCLKLAGVDQVGNKAATTINVKVDTHPPGAPLLSGEIQGRGAARLTWSRNNEPDLAGYNIYRGSRKLNTDLLGTNSLEYLDSGLTEGSYAWQVTAVDLAGQESLPSAEVRLTVDLTPPEGRILSPDNNATVTDQVSIKGTAFSKDDFREYRVWVGAGAMPATWQLIRRSPLPVNYGELAQWETAGLSEGTFQIKLEAEDLAGNVKTHQITVTVDNQPPKAPVLSKITVTGVPQNNAGITWEGNSELDLAGYLLYRNDALANAPGVVTGNLKPYLLAAGAVSYTDSGLPDGTFEYYLLAMDQAGNLSEPSNVLTVEIDTHPPHVQIVTPTSGTAFEHSLLIRGESPDLDIATVQFQFKPAAATVWTDLGPKLALPPYLINLDPKTLNLEYGDFYIQAKATDLHGNEDQSPQEIMVKYTDLTPPAAPQNLHSLTQGNVVSLTWDANSETDLIGYNVYRANAGAVSPLTITPIKEAAFQDQGVADGEHLYQVTAVDLYGNESAASSQVLAKVYRPILIQPPTPVGVAEMAVAGGGVQAGDQVELFKDSDSGTVSVGTVTADQDGNFAGNLVLSLGDNALTAKASDAAGNNSNLSVPVHVFFDEPPATPTGLTGTATGFDVKLTWDANSEPDLAYHLYRDGKVITQQVQVRDGSATAYPDSYPSNAAGKAFDGNTATSWYSDRYYSRWWELDSGTVTHPLKRVELYWGSGSSAARNFSLQIWGEEYWQTLRYVTSNTLSRNIIELDSPVSTSRLRVYISDQSYYSGVVLSEVKVFEEVPLLITSTTFNDLNLPDGNHHYQVSAVDTLGLESPLSAAITVPVGDVTPPAPPANLAAFAFGPDVLLTWDANAEDDLAGYNIYRQEAGEWRKLNGNVLPTPGFTDPALANGSYTYRVTAVDKAGNESDPSASTTISLNLSPPPPPDHLTVTPVATGNALVVCWQGEAEAEAYNLYRGGVSGGPYDFLANSPQTATCYQDEGLVNGTTYYYVVTGTNLRGESAYSTEAYGKPAPADTIPGAPPAPIILNPVAGGGEVTLAEPFTTVSGLAEPGSMVGLYREGALVGTTQVAGDDAVVSFTPGNYPYGYKLSPDGGKVFYGDFDYSQGRQRLAVYDYGTGANFESPAVGPLGYLDGDWWRRSWSPDGLRVAVGFNDDNGQGMVWLSDPGSDQWLRLHPAPGGVWLGDWSPDGQRLALGYYDAADEWRMSVYDQVRDSYSAPDVPAGRQCDFSAWSPDGQQISLDCYNDTSSWLGLYDPGIGSLSQVVPPEGNCWVGEWSPDGRFISLSCYDDTSDWLEVYDPASELFSKITFPGSSDIFDPVWSPDGQWLAFKYWDEMSGAKGAVYDLRSGSASQIDLPDDLQTISYDWSPDSAGLLISATDFAGATGNYLDALDTGMVTGILDSTYEVYSHNWLPSGKDLVLSVYSTLEDHNLLYRFTLGRDTPVELPAADDPADYMFSPDRSRLAYRNGNGLNVLDLATGTFATYDYPADMVYWSQDGRQIAATSWTDSGDDIWLLPLDAPEQARMVYRGSASRSWVNDLFLATDGRITMVASGKLVRIAPSGSFSFPDVPLPNRKNIFTAAATDPAGNIGPLSEAVTVNLAAAALPDLEVNTNDIFILPLSPTVGEEVQLEVAIRNRGTVTARNLTAEVYLQQADGMLLFLASAEIPELGGDQETYLDLSWNSLGQAGINKVFVILDPHDLIPEGNENNNQAAREFLVAGGPELTLTATLNRDHFLADEVLNLDLIIANGGPACPLRVESTIEDGAGNTVAELPFIDKTLAYGGVDDELLAWPVGGTLTGGYRARVVLKDAAGLVLDERLLPFTILTDLRLQASLGGDAVHYGPGQVVRLAARINNLSASQFLPELEARLFISSADGEIYAESRRFTNLLGGGSAEFTTDWPVGLSAPGDYTAGLTVWYQGQEVAVADTGFVVDSLSTLTGSLQVEPKVVPLGSPVNIVCGLGSSGNSAAGPRTVTVRLLDNLSQVVLAQTDLAADLTAADSWSGSVTFAAGLLYPGNFRVLLQHSDGAASILLAEQTFSVADLTAPVVRVLSPPTGALLSVAPQLTVAVSDNSGGVGLVEYRYDQGAWRPLPLVDAATGRYGTLLNVGEADEGDHLLAFRATDLVGNTSTPVTVAVALRGLVELAMAVIPGQAGLAEEVNGRLNLVNHGWAKSVSVQSWIEDGGGMVVNSFHDQSLRLAVDETREQSRIWNVGASPAGPYRLRGRVLRNGTVMEEGSAEFTVRPTIVLTGAIRPDRTSYGIDTPVKLAATLASQSNFTIPLLTARLVITDADNIPIYTGQQPVADLAAGTSRSFDFAWNTGHVRAGHYVATLTLLVNDRDEASAVGELAVAEVPAVSGSISLARRMLPPGENPVVELTVNNGGNLPLAPLPVRLTLTDPAGVARPIAAWTPDLEIDGVFHQSEELLGKDLALGEYRLQLECDLSGKSVVLAEAAFTVADIAPAKLTVLAPRNGAVFSGPFELSVLAEGGSGGVAAVEYQLDSGTWRPLPAQSSPGHYGLTWTPVATESGSHLLYFRAVDKGGNIVSSSPVNIAISFCQPFAALSGTLASQPQPLYQGREINFNYNLLNSCGVDLGELAVQLLVTDQPTGVTTYTQITTVNLAAQASQAGKFSLSPPGLTAGNYSAVLRVTAAGQGERDLATVRLSVLPEPGHTVEAGNRRHLLVWLNYACAESGSDLSVEERCSCPAESTPPGGGGEPCLRGDLLHQALDGAVEYYHLARDRTEFEAELRNPLVTDILILGDHLPLSEIYQAELREKINSGAGLIASLWLPSGDPGLGSATEKALLGTVGEGRYNQAEPRRLQTIDSPVTLADELGVLGSVKVTAAPDSSVVGWLVAGAEPGEGRSRDGSDGSTAAVDPDTGTSPAIVLHDYGQGRTIYYAFDYGSTLTGENLSPLAGLLSESLRHVHRIKTVDEATLAPLMVLPLQWEATSLGEDQHFWLQTAVPPGLRLYDYQSGTWRWDGGWQSGLLGVAAQSGVLPFAVLAPDGVGSFDLAVEADTAPVAGGAVSTLWQDRYSFSVPSDRDSLVTAARGAISQLRVARYEGAMARKISTYLGNVRLRLVLCDRDIEQNLQDLVGAAAALLVINNAQVPDLRLRLDELLRIEESRWYFHAGESCRDDDDAHRQHRPESAGR